MSLSQQPSHTAVGLQDWVDAARRHSAAVQEIRGSGPLVSGLMGMDLCCGCCQLDISERLSAEQVTDHPFSTCHQEMSAVQEAMNG